MRDSSCVRMFCALPVPESQGEGLLSRAQNEWVKGAEGLRWQALAHLHITLSFCAQFPLAALPGFYEIILESAAIFDQPTICLTHYGVLSVGEARSVWVAYCQASDNLLALHDHLNAYVARYGGRLDDRAFLPHITLLRHAMPVDSEVLPEGGICPPIGFEASSIVLMRSDGSYMPRYTRLIEARWG